MKVIRALNNSAVLACDDDGVKVVLMGKGIGFGCRLGDLVDETTVTHRFVPDTAHNIGVIADVVDGLPLEVVRAATDIAEYAQQRLHLTPSQGLTLCLADHLRFMLLRCQREQIVAYPLHWEVRQLYPAEFAAGREAVNIATRTLGQPVPPEEAVAFAMHFVNAGFAGDDLTPTVAMTKRIHTILDIVGAELPCRVDEESMSVARFITHVRYLCARIASGTQIHDAPEMAAIALNQNHPSAYRAALRVAALFESEGTALSSPEISYLALHIARLSRDAV